MSFSCTLSDILSINQTFLFSFITSLHIFKAKNITLCSFDKTGAVNNKDEPAVLC
jgi:hypothetical protein